MIIVKYISDDEDENTAVTCDFYPDKKFEDIVKGITETYKDSVTARDRIRVIEVEIDRSTEIIPKYIVR